MKYRCTFCGGSHSQGSDCPKYLKWARTIDGARNKIKKKRPRSGRRLPAIHWRMRAKLLRSDPKCALCGAENNLQLDHVVPVFRGGTYDESNLRLLCAKCHRVKTNDDRRRESRRREVASMNIAAVPTVPRCPDVI